VGFYDTEKKWSAKFNDARKEADQSAYYTFKVRKNE